MAGGGGAGAGERVGFPLFFDGKFPEIVYQLVVREFLDAYDLSRLDCSVSEDVQSSPPQYDERDLLDQGHAHAHLEPPFH